MGCPVNGKHSERDDRALLAIARLEIEDGVRRPRARAALYEAARMGRGQFRCAEASLVRRGLLQTDGTTCEKGTAQGYVLTPTGLARCADLGWSARVQPGCQPGSSPADDDDLSLSPIETKKEESSSSSPEPARVQPGSTRASQPGYEPGYVVHRHEHVHVHRVELPALPDHLAGALLDTLARFAQRDPKPNSAAGPPCKCGKPTKKKPRRDGTGEGWACVDWTNNGGGCPTWIPVGQEPEQAPQDDEDAGPSRSERDRAARDAQRALVEAERARIQAAADDGLTPKERLAKMRGHVTRMPEAS